MNESFFTLEEEYYPEYCSKLEAAYGQGMMSEGGTEALEAMFDEVSLEKKKALDVGCGLGGVPFYLANKYQMIITGLEVNPWMVQQAKKRTPLHLKEKVNFVLSTSNVHLDFPKESFDLVYSKEVLSHIENKEGLFREFHRILKKKGTLIITDWLCKEEKKWGPNVERLVELEHLTLFPENEKGYMAVFKKAGFKTVTSRDESTRYARYNREIASHLNQSPQKESFLKRFDQKALSEAIEGYESIAKALECGELRTIRFVAKPD